MRAKRQNWIARLRASVTLIPFIAVWLSVPVALASSEWDFCSMLCCVEDGYCCCSPRKPFIKDRDEKQDKIIAIERQPTGPKDCAVAAFSINNSLHESHTAAQEVALRLSAVIPLEQNLFIFDHFQCTHLSPRAPPYLLTR